MYLADLLVSLTDLIRLIPDLEYMLAWVKSVCVHHMAALSPAATAGRTRGVAALGPPLQALSRAVAKVHEDLSGAAERNLFALDYLCAKRPGEGSDSDDESSGSSSSEEGDGDGHGDGQSEQG